MPTQVTRFKCVTCHVAYNTKRKAELCEAAHAEPRNSSRKFKAVKALVEELRIEKTYDPSEPVPDSVQDPGTREWTYPTPCADSFCARLRDSR